MLVTVNARTTTPTAGSPRSSTTRPVILPSHQRRDVDVANPLAFVDDDSANGIGCEGLAGRRPSVAGGGVAKSARIEVVVLRGGKIRKHESTARVRDHAQRRAAGLGAAKRHARAGDRSAGRGIGDDTADCACVSGRLLLRPHAGDGGRGGGGEART